MKPRLPTRTAHFAAAACLLASIATAQEDITPLELPAPEGSGQASLSATPGGATFVSWVEPTESGHALRFAELQRGGTVVPPPEGDEDAEAEASEEVAAPPGEDSWGPAQQIAEGEHWFVNFADHPSIAALGGDQLAAHWLVKNPEVEGHYGYGLKIAHSADRGAAWREVFAEGLDNTESYSGFVSFTPEPGGFSAAYLTPPPGATDPGDMTLRLSRFHEQGYQLGDQRLDADVCSCCPTGMATIADQPVVVYRDRVRNPPEDELRDIAIARKVRGIWNPGSPVHPDGWGINACPVNGPAIAARNGGMAVVWFTMASGEPEVRLAFSRDGGASFDLPLRLDGGDPRGYTGITMLDDGSAVAVWLESTGGNRAEVRLRQAWPNGRLESPVLVADAPAGRDAGMLKVVRVADEAPEADEDEEAEEEAAEDLLEDFFDPDERLMVAWRDGRVLTAVVRLGSTDGS